MLMVLLLISGFLLIVACGSSSDPKIPEQFNYTPSAVNDVLTVKENSSVGNSNQINVSVNDNLGKDGGDSDNSERVRKLTTKLQNVFPKMKVVLQDERFSSKMAMQSMIDSGMKKMKRREKGEIDKVSAAIILQSYMEAKGF